MIWLKNGAAVWLGGAIGSLSRASLMMLFPISGAAVTLIVNLVGSFTLAFFNAWWSRPHWPRSVQLGIGVGFCGGFTTMSTFAYDAYVFESGLVSYYVAAMVIGGIGSCYLGHMFGRRLANC